MGSDSKIRMFSTQKVTLGQIRWLERNSQKQLKHCHKHQDIDNGNLPKKFGSTMMMNFFLRMERNVNHGYNKKGYSLKK